MMAMMAVEPAGNTCRLCILQLLRKGLRLIDMMMMMDDDLMVLVRPAGATPAVCTCLSCAPLYIYIHTY